MLISLSKNSDVPLRLQLTEQIVFLITTGQLRAGEEMPSVRSLARRLHVHHNTVSDAYQELVRRAWLTGRHGSRLIVRASRNEQLEPASLDELINDSIRRAKDMGYSLQALHRRVRERLLGEPPDHILIVEDEEGLREIIRREILNELTWSVEGCSWQQFRSEPALAVGAQVVAPRHIAEELKQLVPAHRPVISIDYSDADHHLKTIQMLKRPSIVAVVSISESLMKTARSLLAPAIGRKHVFREIPVANDGQMKLDGVDLVFGDSIAIPLVICRRKIHYQLIPPSFLEDLAAALDPNL
jgi:GntR family transcriptional regulator